MSVSTLSPPSSMVLSFYGSSSLSPPPTPAKRARKTVDDTTTAPPMFFPANLSVIRGPVLSETSYSSSMVIARSAHKRDDDKKERIRQHLLRDPPSLLNSRPLPCMQLKPRPRSMTTNAEIPASTTPHRIKLEDIPPLPFACSSTTTTAPSLTSSNSLSSNDPNNIINKMPSQPSCQVKSSSFNESSSYPPITKEEKKMIVVPSRTNSLPAEDTSSKRLEKLPSFQKSGLHFKSKRRTSLTFVPRAA